MVPSTDDVHRAAIPGNLSVQNAGSKRTDFGLPPLTRVLSSFCIIRSFSFSPSTQQSCEYRRREQSYAIDLQGDMGRRAVDLQNCIKRKDVKNKLSIKMCMNKMHVLHVIDEI